MIVINSNIQIHKDELKFEFMRASGPGGQNVNKVNSAVLLRFDLDKSSLPEIVRRQLRVIAGKHLTDEGMLLIKAKAFRTQIQNRKDAVDRLAALIKRAAIKPKCRRKTKMSPAVKNRILDSKRHRSKIKQTRRAVRNDIAI